MFFNFAFIDVYTSSLFWITFVTRWILTIKASTKVDTCANAIANTFIQTFIDIMTCSITGQLVSRMALALITSFGVDAYSIVTDLIKAFIGINAGCSIKFTTFVTFYL